MKIVLIGYMASGKSAVGRELSQILAYPFLDLDDYIELKEGKSISAIFADDGEIYFRAIEANYLLELLSNEDDLVLSLGGGTPCYGSNIDVILEKSISYYLKTSIQTIHSRLMHEKSKRPLVASISKDGLQEFIARHLFERRSFYERANYQVTTDNLTITEVVSQLVENQSI